MAESHILSPNDPRLRGISPGQAEFARWLTDKPTETKETAAFRADQATNVADLIVAFGGREAYRQFVGEPPKVR